VPARSFYLTDDYVFPAAYFLRSWQNKNFKGSSGDLLSSSNRSCVLLSQWTFLIGAKWYRSGYT